LRKPGTKVSVFGKTRKPNHSKKKSSLVTDIEGFQDLETKCGSNYSVEFVTKKTRRKTHSGY